MNQGNQWVAVKDRTPDENQIVFLFDGVQCWVGSYVYLDEDTGWFWTNTYGTFYWDGDKWDGDQECDDDYTPTHWCPLPCPLDALMPSTAGEPRCEA